MIKFFLFVCLQIITLMYEPHIYAKHNLLGSVRQSAASSSQVKLSHKFVSCIRSLLLDYLHL